MTVTLTYDGTLSRVRIAATALLNANPYFETDVTDWTPFGGTAVRSTAQFHEGVASLLLTPDGVTSTTRIESGSVAASAGTSYRISAWVRCAVARTVQLSINWYDAGFGYLSTSPGPLVSVAANTWTLLEFTATAPSSTGGVSGNVLIQGTPPASHLLYVDEAMLEIVAADVERSTNQVNWTTVRGGAALTPSAGVLSLDDYEFAADVVNYYRVSGQTATITPTLTQVWIKSIARPFLNRAVTILDFSDIERASRTGVFDVVGRSYPVAVNDLRGSRRWTLDVLTSTLAEAADFDLVLASGDPLFVHVPADCPVPGGYVTVGSTGERRTARRSVRRVFSLPCVEVAAPGPDVVGASVNWQTVVNAYATWSDLLAAHPTWASVLELIGSPTDVVVP